MRPAENRENSDGRHDGEISKHFLGPVDIMDKQVPDRRLSTH
jgi:hypothetical protein